MSLTMPRLNVAFRSSGSTFVKRGARGTVLMILRDAALGGTHLSLSRATDAPAALSGAALASINRAFLGGANRPRRVLLYIAAPTAGLTDALAWAASQQFEYLAGPSDITAEECETVAAWISDQRSNYHAPCRAVLPSYAGDAEGVINFCGAGLSDGVSSITAGDYCARIAGLLAGTPVQRSATYAPLDDLADCARLTNAALDTAVGLGQLVTWHDGTRVRLGRAVTSLTSGSGDLLRKIKIVAAMDMIRADLRGEIRDNYIGQYPNTYDNKMILVTAIRDYFLQLETDGVLQPGWSVEIDAEAQRVWLEAHGTNTTDMDEAEVLQAATGSEVFIVAAVRFFDAIEDVTVNISM
ncbi:MAG: phage tail sheath subtilisin-like domain-containing protein [Oscillospiraceae bacterium]|nr:phage tail sheath subtilisin-like domain-containing protein [Oscillospiraceae bacterium]